MFIFLNSLSKNEQNEKKKLKNGKKKKKIEKMTKSFLTSKKNFFFAKIALGSV